MAYEQREGDIAIFSEKDKKNERAPDWKGTALINGQKMEVALWLKGQNGTMLAGAIKPAREYQRQDDRQEAREFRQGGAQGVSGGGGSSRGQSHAQAGRPNLELDDEIPFISCGHLW